MSQGKRSAVSAARVFSQQPDRVAAAWRRVRLAQAPHGTPVHNLLDDVVEPFIRELGRCLEGFPGSPWERTRGVLRVSPERGTPALQEEFFTLLRCLGDALQVLGATPPQQQLVRGAVQEAMDSALAYSHQLSDTAAAPPRVPFGGLVVEVFERRAAPHALHSTAPSRGVH